MYHTQLLAYCLQKPSTYLDYPFEPMTPVVKVGVPQQSKGRIFAQMLVLRGEPKITLRCTPESAALYRSRYPGSVVPGWHCPAVQKPHFNTVCLDGSVPDDELLRMIDHAYAVAAAEKCTGYAFRRKCKNTGLKRPKTKKTKNLLTTDTKRGIMLDNRNTCIDEDTGAVQRFSESRRLVRGGKDGTVLITSEQSGRTRLLVSRDGFPP